MRALLCATPGTLRVEERAEPIPAKGEVLIRIRRAGVCGTDLHIFEGTHPFLAYPRVIGHELAGEVVEAPPGSTLAPGRPVSIIPYLACGACVACRRGKTNCCQKIRVLGVHSDGGMADFVCVPEENVIAADGVSLDEAAMVEFLAIGAHAVRRSAMVKGDRVLVVGAGPIGMACMIFAKLRGASVIALDLRADRLDFCRKVIGIESSVLVGAEALQTLSRMSDGDFFDVVIDATGNAKAMMAGLAYVAHGGAYVLVSVVKDAITFPDPELHKRETTLLASRNATREDFEIVLDALRAGRVPTDALLTHRASLADAATRFPFWIDPASGVIKAMIEI